MSAIGTYVVISRENLQRCAALASAVRTETSGWGPFKKTAVLGRAEFDAAWQSSVLASAAFDHSGYALSNYLTALEAVSGYTLPELEPDASKALARVFTSVIPLTQQLTLPVLAPDRLRDHCASEYGSDADSAFEAITAADRFYRSALEKASPDQVAVVLIQ